MATFLVGWELGGERGHAALLEPVVAALRERGHVVHVAIKDLDAPAAGSVLRQNRLFQAPAWPPPGPGAAGRPTSQTVGDDLVVAGLGDARPVVARARAWLDLIETLGADVVLAETAPTLLVAARGRRPSIAFGTAYSLPPSGLPLPVARDVSRKPAAASAVNEAALRDAFDMADRSLGGRGLGRFSELFDGPTWVCNLKELDPYAALRPQPAPGPLLIRHAGEAVLAARTPRPAAENVFVYVKPTLLLPTLMDALAPRCRRIELYIAGAPPDLHNPWPHVVLHRHPVDLEKRLHEFSAVVHFGGLNLAAEALFAGVPQLVFPQHLEQNATGAAVQALGLGHVCQDVPRESEREAERRTLVPSAVEAFFADASLGERAARFAAGLRARQAPSLPGLVDLCERVAGGLS